MKAADRARRRPAAADRNAEALLWRRGAGSCTRTIDLFCAPPVDEHRGPAVRADRRRCVLGSMEPPSRCV